MNLFEILKAKHGILTSDLKTMLWRNNANPSEYDVTITSTPPLYLPYSLGYNLSDWSITGQTVQDGEPTPENPVDVQGVGEKTGNLCKITTDNIVYYSATYSECTINNNTIIFNERENYGTLIGFKAEAKPNTHYTVTLTKTSSATLRIREYTESPINWNTNFIIQSVNTNNNSATFTTAKNTNYLLVCLWVDSSWTPCMVFNIMLNEGTTALPYEPFGCKIPVVTRGTEGAETTTNIYLDSPLMDGETVSSDGEREVEWGAYVLTSETQITRRTTDEVNSYYCNLDELRKPNTEVKSSHYEWGGFKSQSVEEGKITGAVATSRIWIWQNGFNSVDEFKSWLDEQKANGTPVTVYYQLATPTTSTITPPNIPTTTGTCVLDVDTSVQPSSVTATYKSSVPDNDMQDMISLLAEI